MPSSSFGVSWRALGAACLYAVGEATALLRSRLRRRIGHLRRPA